MVQLGHSRTRQKAHEAPSFPAPLELQLPDLPKPPMKPGLRHFRAALKVWLERTENLVQFRRLEKSGQLECREMSANELRNIYGQGKLLFREPTIHRSQLDQIALPLVPAKLTAPNAQPVIVVQFGDELVVMQGNHRLYKAIHENSNDHPVQLISLKTPAAWESLFGMPFLLHNGRLGFPNPPVD